jgi:hypothetical protein
MSATEDRKALLDAATELLVELRRITAPVNAVMNRLIEHADELKLEAADEHDAARGTIVRKLKIKDLAAAASPSSGRACSLCREPGHTAPNCPKAGEIQEVKKAEVAARPEPKKKRVMKPLSPERKAALAETLKIARAARAKKKFLKDVKEFWLVVK